MPNTCVKISGGSTRVELSERSYCILFYVGAAPVEPVLETCSLIQSAV